jgi:hypothetical protein
MVVAVNGAIACIAMITLAKPISPELTQQPRALARVDSQSRPIGSVDSQITADQFDTTKDVVVSPKEAVSGSL